MKKGIIYILSFTLLIGFFSCETDVPEPWNSSTTDFDGDWLVRYDHASYGEDPWGVGFVENHAYNTASNDGSEIWLEDHGAFWDYKVKVKINADNLTFGSDELLYNISQIIVVDTIPVSESTDDYEIDPVVIRNAADTQDSALIIRRYHKTTIKNGKIVKNAITMPSALVVDSIYYEVWFEDLEGATGIADDVVYVGGYRKTGFTEDDPNNF